MNTIDLYVVLKGAPYGNRNAAKDYIPQQQANDKVPSYPKEEWKKSMSGIDVLKMLKKSGWEVERVSGSHHWMKRPGYKGFPVAAHRADVGIGLMKAYQKQSQMLE